MNRRAFIRSALAAGAFPFLPGCGTFPFGAKVRLAAIGIGAQGWADLQRFAANGDICEVVALCDTDLGSPHTLSALCAWPSVPHYRDFRVMFDRMDRSIDAVLVATPDHSHFCATMEALRRGKAVFVEKPLAHTFRECELLLAAARKTGVVTQMGNQGHSGDNFFQYRDYVSSGVIRDVVKVVAHMNMERRWHKWNGAVRSFPAGEKVPGTLDWECWLSSAAFHEYSKDFVGGEWRCWYDFGGGCLGDWGSHILDTVHRFTLGCDLPSEVGISNVTGFNPFVYPVQDTLTMKFPATDAHGAVTLEWWEGLRNQPKPPEGFAYDSNAGLFPANGANDGLVDPKLKPGKEIYCADGTVWQGLSHAAPLKRVGNGGNLPAYERATHDHYRNFLLAVRGEEEAKSPFAVTAALTELSCLGIVAQRLNRGFRFDPAKREIVGDEIANALLKGPAPRKGWEEYYEA